MKTITKLAAAVALAVGAGSAFATPMDASTIPLDELQTGVFDVIGSTIDTNTDETQSEIFSFQTTGATATYVATVSYSASDIRFGLYDKNDKSIQVDLFDTSWATSNAPGDSTQVYIDYNGIDVTTYTMAGGYQELDSATFSSAQFGFFAESKTPGGYGIWYSESDKNAANFDVNGDGVLDNDHFLTYAGKGDAVDLDGAGPAPSLSDAGHWYIAAEVTDMAGSHPSYYDYTDIVVQVESMVPVPVPATLALMGLGLVGMGMKARRRKA